MRINYFTVLGNATFDDYNLNSRHMPYHYSKKLNLPFEEVVKKVRLNLLDQGFSLMTTMDMQDTLKHRLSVDFRNYYIMSVCHPLLAYKAISLEPHIGILLPCNVVIQERENGMVEVAAVNHLETMDHNMSTTTLELVAAEISDRLRTAIDTLQIKKQAFSFSIN
jgi:uncharacterized protein (DUF302 family)